MKLNKGYSYKEGKFYNSKGEEVKPEEAIESTDSQAESAPAEGVSESESPAEGSEQASEESSESSEDESKALLKNIDELVDAKIKALNIPKTKDVNQVQRVSVKSGYDRMSKEEKFKQFVVAFKNNDYATLKAAGNTTSHGAVIPPTEFIAEVQRLEDEYGVARRNADVRSTTRSSITMILGEDDLEVSIVGEAGFKPSKKINYTPFELTFRKGVGILPLTDELLEDSAVDLFRDATQRAARAFTKKEDQFVFTDATSGIVNQAGIHEFGVDDLEGENGINLDSLSQLMYAVPTPSFVNGKFYLHQTILGAVSRIKDNEGRPIWMPSVNGPMSGTLFGRPYEIVQVLPDLNTAEEGDALVIYGDLRYTTLADRTGMKVDTSNVAVVGDPDEEDQEANTLNSWTQDLTSMRFVKRFNAKVRFPEAYSVLRLGAVS